MSKIGVASSMAMWWASMRAKVSALPRWPDDLELMAHADGMAYGRAFRAAELAYDLGHRHAVDGERRRLAAQLDDRAYSAAPYACTHLITAAAELRGIDNIQETTLLRGQRY